MNLSRLLLPLFTLALLGGCGDSAKQTTAGAPEAPAETAAPAGDMSAAAVPAEAPSGDGADAFYARTCSTCHGPTAEGVGSFPNLSKLGHDTILARLKAYRAGEKVGPMSATMAPIAKKLSDEQIEALATYLGS